MITFGLVLLASAAAPAVDCPAGAQPRTRQTPEASEAWCEGADGQREGPRVGTYADGTRWFTGAYQRGQRAGEWRFWFPSGKPRTTSHYEGDRRHGAYQAWHESGELAESGTCENGVETGTWSRWYPNGKLELKIEMQKGEPKARHYFTRRGASTDLNGFVAAKLPGAAPQDPRYQNLLREYGQGRVFTACSE